MNTLLLSIVASALACPFAAMMRTHADSHAMMAELAKAAHAKANVDVNVHEKRALRAADVVQTFVLSSRVKTPTGNSFGQGFPVGYAVNGVETPEINVIAGKTYNFTVLSACNHPFYLTTDSRGKGRLPMNVGFDTPPVQLAQPVCAGASILWKPDETLIGKDIWYHCTVHDNMGWFVRVKKQSFCDKYTELLKLQNNKKLLTLVVDAVVDKLVDPKSAVIEYFDGTIPTNSVNFLDPRNALKTVALSESLVNFFGAALGCSDGSIPPYTGGSMKEVHKNMPISGLEYDFFIKQIDLVLKDSGVSNADAQFVQDLLNSADVRGAVCNFGDACFDSICTKYSKALNKTNLQVMNLVVDEAFKEVLALPSQKPFFDGSVPAGSVNFFADAAKTAELKKNFAAFLGRADVLGCTDAAFPAARIDIPGLRPVHQKMPIGPVVFKEFNDAVIKALTTLGIEAGDRTAIRKVLDSTDPLICNQPGCAAIPATVTKAFDLTVVPKVMGHHWFGQGFASAFKLDGQTVEGLVLEAGKTYAFKASQGCSHPFYFTNGTGSGSPRFENGVLSTDIGQKFCSGKILTFTPKTEDIGKILFYACESHNFMGGRLCIVAEGMTNTPCTVAGAMAMTPPATPCDDLVDAVKRKVAGTADQANFKDSNDIITSVVVQTFTAALGTPLKKFFDGTFPTGSRDFVMNNKNQGELVVGLTNFFGRALGCSDNKIPARVGAEPNLKLIHQSMGIEQGDFDAFNAALLSVMGNFKGLGVGVNPRFVPGVSAFLNTSITDVCSKCGAFQAASICEKWATAAKTTQLELVQGAVLAVFGDLTAKGAPTRPFFDGTVPCQSPNFIDNVLKQGGLAKRLTAFFGQQGVLGCSDPAFPPYEGNPDMEDVHKEMPITKDLFDLFVNSLVAYVNKNLKAAVPDLQKDIDAIAALMATPGVAKLCNQDGCPIKGKYVERKCDTPPTGGNTTNSGEATTTKPVPKDDAASVTGLAVAAVAGSMIALLAL